MSSYIFYTGAALGPKYSGCSIAYEVISGSDGSTIAGSTSTGVQETSVAGTFEIRGGITLQEAFQGRISWVVNGSRILDEFIDPRTNENADVRVSTRLAGSELGSIPSASDYTAARGASLDNLVNLDKKVGSRIAGSEIGNIAAASDMSNVVNRIGLFSGTGSDTVLGFFLATLRKDVTAPSQIGGAYDPADDSQEAIRDRGDAAWITATGSGLDLTASAIWTYATRTLTQAAAAVEAAVTGGSITLTRGVSFEATLTGLDFTDRDNVWFTVKNDYINDPDSEAVLQLSSCNGLLQVQGASATGSDGALSFPSASSLKINIVASAMDNLIPRDKLDYDIKMKKTSGCTNLVSLGLDQFKITSTVTRT